MFIPEPPISRDYDPDHLVEYLARSFRKISDYTATLSGSGTGTSRVFNVQDDFGGEPDGVTDNVGPIWNAVQAAKASTSKAAIVLNAGTWLVDSLTPRSGSIESVLLDGDNLTLVFMPGAVLKKGNSVGGAVINVEDVTSGNPILSAAIYGARIDGNRANNNDGHGIRGKNVDGFRIHDFHIWDAAFYGIGLVTGTGMYQRNVQISHGLIERTSSDGIDIKNFANLNKAVQIDQVIIREAGLNATLSNQACLDFRGQVQVSNVHCEVKSVAGVVRVGVQAQFDDASGTAGNGAHHSQIVNAHVVSDATDSVTGFDIQGRDVKVVNCSAFGCHDGARFRSSRPTVRGLECSDGHNGVSFEAPGSGMPGAGGMQAAGLIVRNNAGDGVIIVADGAVEAHAEGNNRNWNIGSVVTDFHMRGAALNPVTTNVNDSAGKGKTHAYNVRGWKTSQIVDGTSVFDVRTTGSYTEAFTVALAFQPSWADIRLSWDYVSTNRDMKVDYGPVVITTGATLIQARFRVGTGDTSATAANVRLGLYVDMRP